MKRNIQSQTNNSHMVTSKSKKPLFAGLSWGLKPGKAWLQTGKPNKKPAQPGVALPLSKKGQAPLVLFC
jgi:hypothetical protein